jgi:hypothetical protein
MVEPQSAGAVMEEVLDEPVLVGGHVVPEGNWCFQLLALCRMPEPPSMQAMNDTDDNDWAFVVAAAIEVGVIRVGMRLGFWTMGDMRSDFILTLLEDYSSNVEELCSMYHSSLENPCKKPVAKSSKTLVAIEGFDEEGKACLNRFTFKSDYQVYNGCNGIVDQMVVRLMGSNKGGQKRQLGQITLNLHRENRVFGDADCQKWIVEAHDRPFVAAMFMRGVMQAIHWYNSRNILLPEMRIRQLIMNAKGGWEYLKRGDNLRNELERFRLA